VTASILFPIFIVNTPENENGSKECETEIINLTFLLHRLSVLQIACYYKLASVITLIRLLDKLMCRIFYKDSHDWILCVLDISRSNQLFMLLNYHLFSESCFHCYYVLELVI